MDGVLRLVGEPVLGRAAPGREVPVPGRAVPGRVVPVPGLAVPGWDTRGVVAGDRALPAHLPASRFSQPSCVRR